MYSICYSILQYMRHVPHITRDIHGIAGHKGKMHNEEVVCQIHYTYCYALHIHVISMRMSYGLSEAHSQKYIRACILVEGWIKGKTVRT